MADPLGRIGPSAPGLARPVLRPDAAAENAAAGGQKGVDFQDILIRSLDQVNQLDAASQDAIAEQLSGSETMTQAEVFMAVKKADLAFRTMLQIRNKLVEAYNEIKQMRM